MITHDYLGGFQHLENSQPIFLYFLGDSNYMFATTT